MLAFLPRRSGVNQVWIASVLMFDATSDRSLSVRSRSRSAMSTSTSARGVLGCAVMLDSDPCADNIFGSVSVRLFNAEVTSVVPSSTFVVFKFKSASSTSVLAAGSPTFDPTGVALVLHPILERVLGLVLGLLLLERAESGDSFWTPVCTVSSPGCTPTVAVALVLVCAVRLAYVVPVASLQSAAMCPGWEHLRQVAGWPS